MGREDGTVLQIHKTQQPRDSPAQHEKDYTFPDGSMVKAIRHEHIRAELLHQAEATHSWKHPQPHGAAPDDRNAPCAEPPDQLDYGWTQHHYPAINFILKKRGYIQPEYEVKDVSSVADHHGPECLKRPSMALPRTPLIWDCTSGTTMEDLS